MDAIHADTKLIPAWLVGPRDTATAKQFVRDLESRLASRVQITWGGLRLCVHAVEIAFGWNGPNFAQLIKRYSEGSGGVGPYGPGVVTWIEKR